MLIYVCRIDELLYNQESKYINEPIIWLVLASIDLARPGGKQFEGNRVARSRWQNHSCKHTHTQKHKQENYASCFIHLGANTIACQSAVECRARLFVQEKSVRFGLTHIQLVHYIHGNSSLRWIRFQRYISTLSYEPSDYDTVSGQHHSYLLDASEPHLMRQS